MSKTLVNTRNAKVIGKWQRETMSSMSINHDRRVAECYDSWFEPKSVQGGNTVNHNAMQVLTIAAVMEIEDPQVYTHCLRVAGYAVTIARHMQLSPADIIAIEQAALLHDVGKIAVAGSILNKPARLTDHEYECVKQHSIVGEQVVRKIPELLYLAPLIRSHHEWYDGHGYPDCISGDSIPLGGRIIAVADAFDAMTSDRPYRKARSIMDSVNELSFYSNTQFDPAVVEAFFETMGDQQALCCALSEGTRSFFQMLLTFEPTA